MTTELKVEELTNSANPNACIIFVIRATISFIALLLLNIDVFDSRAVLGFDKNSRNATKQTVPLYSASTRFVIVTFGSVGPPYDDGLNMQRARAKFESIVGPHADAVRIYAPSDLKSDPWWIDNFHVYPDTVEYVLPKNPGANKVGYWKYKPLLLYRTMESEPDGAIIMYMDVNVVKYPDLTHGVAQWRNVSKHVLAENSPADIWLGYEDPGAGRVKNFCKGYTVRNISDPRFTARIFERSLLLCNRIVVRNTAAARDLMLNEILPLFTNDALLANYPQDGAHEMMYWHTGDQAIWNTFLFNQQYLGRLPRKWPTFAYYKRWRHFTFEGLVPWNDEDWDSVDRGKGVQ
jgi:hypothetical protein